MCAESTPPPPHIFLGLQALMQEDRRWLAYQDGPYQRSFVSLPALVETSPLLHYISPDTQAELRGSEHFPAFLGAPSPGLSPCLPGPVYSIPRPICNFPGPGALTLGR